MAHDNERAHDELPRALALAVLAFMVSRVRDASDVSDVRPNLYVLAPSGGA